MCHHTHSFEATPPDKLFSPFMFSARSFDRLRHQCLENDEKRSRTKSGSLKSSCCERRKRWLRGSLPHHRRLSEKPRSRHYPTSPVKDGWSRLSALSEIIYKSEAHRALFCEIQITDSVQKGSRVSRISSPKSVIYEDLLYSSGSSYIKFYLEHL